MPRCAPSFRPAARSAASSNRVGQIGNLQGDDPQRLLAEDVAVGDPQRFAAFEAAKRAKHGRVVIQRDHFGRDVIDQHLPRSRRAFGQPQQIEALRDR